ncbi:amino acid adenylation domain-containing protein [Nannocystis radixulma]|uniref:Amino acid adenylation domain-containing protein n=1 Tax=Nannocystis radixulma TaxID=2995305 RepID=A0ABT5B774_9BACT|nr:amino acid adenylation domain-containing protein [Nannocystis radixulma]MDC0669964.1 amino acid adenylation domain-containing protein [Nannocystis radixulma]
MSTSVYARFEAQAERAGEATALRHGERVWGYGELAARVRRMAGGLRRAGVRPGDRVGVLLSHSPELVSVLLAVWRAGAAYVPLDPQHPHVRARFVLEDAGATVLVSEPALSGPLRQVAARVVTPAELDAADDDTASEVGEAAYVLYTSGTTGDPRGVVVSHAALASYVAWAGERYDGAASFALYSSLAFDLTVTSLFVPLACGGQVQVFAGDGATAGLFAAADDPRVEVLKLTPGHLALLVARGGAGGRLRRLVVGGEALPTRLARAAQQRFGAGLEIFNEYGPTEATVGCVVHRFDAAHDVRDDVPIGRPTPNATVQLLDAALAPVNDGAVGELFLAGPCLAGGYVGAAEATRRAFLELDGVRHYRTGDLARRLADGTYEFVGRGDGQIKFAGQRVELEGLRALLLRHPEVREAAVLLRSDARGHAALVAYHVADRPLAPAELRAYMTTLVSQDVVPGHFVQLAALPLTGNGKVDTRALPELEWVLSRAGKADARPRTPIEARLAEIWAEALGLAQVGVDDDFYELGGHSLLGNLIILAAREAFGVDLNMRSLFEQRTVAALARHIEDLRVRPPEPAAPEPDLPPRVLDLDAAPAPGRTTDEENLARGGSISGVDEMVGSFYSRYPWPWNSTRFDALEDLEFERVMLSQEFGDYDHAVLSAASEIWVAGCGTNQALLTALRFPRARVLGTDLSTRSLEICAATAAELGVTNLELRLESINDADHSERFDHVICTGVIHHTYEPAHALARLQRALRPAGVLELLVYNRFHRTITSAFQKAVGIMTRGLSSADLAVARRIVAGFALDNTMSRFISRHRDWEETDFADLLINPIEHSYTVDSLAEMAAGCGLELVRPCISLYARFRAENIFWEMRFSDPEVQRVYDELPDLDRWRVSNLLMHEKSPMLWFYLQRTDSPRPRLDERALGEAFLATRFTQARTRQRSHIRGPDGRFRASERAIDFPTGAPEASLRPLYERCDGSRTMAEVFAELGRGTGFASVQQARLMLTIPAFPYLRAVGR